MEVVGLPVEKPRPIKRWLSAAVFAGLLMVADGIALIVVTRAFRPGRPPLWATAPFFWSVAWPVPLFSKLFPQPPGSTDHGPTMLAVAAAAIVDLVLITLLIDRLRRIRLKRRTQPARSAPAPLVYKSP